MTTLREAVKAVLDCWDSPEWGAAPPDLTGDLMEALRAQLEKPEQEPVALIRDGVLRWYIPHEHYSRPAWTAHGTHMLYTFPPQQQAEPVTCTWTPEDDDLMPGTYSSACGELWSFIDGGWKDNHVRFCQGCGGKVVDGANGIGEKP